MKLENDQTRIRSEEKLGYLNKNLRFLEESCNVFQKFLFCLKIFYQIESNRIKIS